MNLSLALLACVGGNADDTGSCAERNDGAILIVQDPGAVCPNPADVDLDQLGQLNGCEGDEITRATALETATPERCGPWLQCTWMCTYAVILRNCEEEPVRCWSV